MTDDLVQAFRSCTPRPPALGCALMVAAAACAVTAGCSRYVIPRSLDCERHGGFLPNYGTQWIWGPTHDDWIEGLDPITEGREVGDGFDAAIALYQRSLRRPTAIGYHCPFVPSCSVYARIAFQQYGPIGGLALTLDRLHIRERGGDLGSSYSTACLPGGSNAARRYFDPPP